ncbi:MAG: Crp/Fnr family transcriptional regulator [Chloroflexi bacterium]|nr:Crp/Fnr family transcriptional regulator [Chloroflexota bacterium]
MKASPTITELLSSHPFFQGLDADTLEQIACYFRARTYLRGEIILLEGDYDCGVYFVQRGVVKILRSSEDGRTQTLTLVGPGHSFNEVPAIDGGPNPASAEAMTECTVCSVSRADFARLLDRYPQIGRAMLVTFAARLRQLVDLASDLTLRTVPQRLAKLLLEQANIAGQLTQHEMAARLGTVREVIGRSLRALADEGLLRVEGHRIVITDPERLRKIAGLE